MNNSINHYKFAELLYANSLSNLEDIKSFRMEGEGAITFPLGRMRMESRLDPGEGQKANLVLWCPEQFPADIAIEWEFLPIREPGLCILFFAAAGQQGEDIFDAKLAARTGEYQMYHHGDINALHVSYFRRRYQKERAFHLCNLRKSYGFHMVHQAADPIPSVPDVTSPYKMTLIKYGAEVSFYINNLPVFHWKDDGLTYGPILGGGKIGFRQMAPLIAEYANFKVHAVEPRSKT